MDSSFRLKCNKQIANYAHHATGQPEGVCAHIPFTDNCDESCIRAKLPNLEHDPEYVLKFSETPLSSSSTHTVPIIGCDTVIKLKMEKSGRYHITGTSTIIDVIICLSTSKIFSSFNVGMYVQIVDEI